MVLEWILWKAFGVLLILVGIFFFLFFPGVPAQQDLSGSSFGKTGILLGVILFFIGMWILIS